MTGRATKGRLTKRGTGRRRTLPAAPRTKAGGLTHVDTAGRARMVDVGKKPVTRRLARAEAFVSMRPETLEAIRTAAIAKGDVLAAARLAGIAAAKRTSELIPLCHPLALDVVTVDLEFRESLPGLRIETEARLSGRTGAEMEALVAASVAALTVYDMCKAIDREMEIGPIELLEKRGGKSGRWTRGRG